MPDCYSGPNPIKNDEQRYAIWKWAKTEGGIDAGVPIEQVGDAINKYFYGGQGKAEWINEILSGRKTPFRATANEMWKKQYNRRIITQQASEISRLKAMGPAGKVLRWLWTGPRSLAVFGHGIVFPFTHAGDLALTPTRWGTFIKGTLKTYRAAPELWGLGSKLGGGKAYVGRVLSEMERAELRDKSGNILAGMDRDHLFNMALQSKLDVGKGSRPSGLISRTYKGAASRAWDMLTVMRFELWKKQMGKYVKPGMSEAEVLDIGKNLAEWANHATGAGTGPISKLGGEVLFGPKLTQSKINRLTVDPIKTVKTFKNWDAATPGERAVAMTRLAGGTQWLLGNLGFLAVNAGVLAWLGQKEKVNYTNPFRGDYFAFKGGGLEGYIPGMHTEVRTLAKVLALMVPERFGGMSRKDLRGESKFTTTSKILGGYALNKLTPSLEAPLEAGFGQNWEGRPLPWSNDPGSPKLPRLTWAEWGASKAPIPASGPTEYVLEQLRKTGMSAPDANTTVKGLMIFGLGLPGAHVTEDYGTPTPRISTKRIPGMPRAIEGHKPKAVH